MSGLKIPEIGVTLTPYNKGNEGSYALIRPILLSNMSYGRVIHVLIWHISLGGSRKNSRSLYI